MHLPFTHEQFLDVFGAFNTSWWPAAAVLWALSALALLGLARGRGSRRLLFLLLALHWGWSGAVYHLGYFAAVNPAARLFGVLFLLQAALFLWAGLARQPPAISWGAAPRQRLSVAFAGYSLLYPLFGLAIGLRWPRMPAFGVPCPTTLLTVAVLLAVQPRRYRWLLVIPALWGLIGGSAALALGILPDLALFLGVLCLVTYAAVPTLLERRAA
jgi:hypothetical protein